MLLRSNTSWFTLAINFTVSEIREGILCARGCPRDVRSRTFTAGVYRVNIYLILRQTGACAAGSLTSDNTSL